MHHAMGKFFELSVFGDMYIIFVFIIVIYILNKLGGLWRCGLWNINQMPLCLNLWLNAMQKQVGMFYCQMLFSLSFSLQILCDWLVYAKNVLWKWPVTDIFFLILFDENSCFCLWTLCIETSSYLSKLKKHFFCFIFKRTIVNPMKIVCRLKSSYVLSWSFWLLPVWLLKLRHSNSGHHLAHYFFWRLCCYEIVVFSLLTPTLYNWLTFLM